MTAEQLPKRQFCAPGLAVMQRTVEGRLAKYGRTAASAVVQRPPDLGPQVLDPLRVRSRDDCNDVVRQRRMDGSTVVPGGVSVADALRAVAVANAHCDQLECGHDPVRGVRQGCLERNAIVSHLDALDFCHWRPSVAIRECGRAPLSTFHSILASLRPPHDGTRGKTKAPRPIARCRNGAPSARNV